MWKFLGGSREAIGLSGVRTYYNDSGVRVFFITLGKGTGYRIPDLNNGLRGTHCSTIKFTLCDVGKGCGEYQMLCYSKFAREDRNLMLCETKVRRKPLCTREAAIGFFMVFALHASCYTDPLGEQAAERDASGGPNPVGGQERFARISLCFGSAKQVSQKAGEHRDYEMAHSLCQLGASEFRIREMQRKLKMYCKCKDYEFFGQGRC